MAIVYFDLHFEEDNAEEDYQNNLEEILEDDPDKYKFLISYFTRRTSNLPPPVGGDTVLIHLENKAINAVVRLFSPLAVGNEGYNQDGSLNMYINISSYADVEKVEGILSDNYTGGEDNIEVGVMYYEARDFMFFPQGVNGPIFGPDYHSPHPRYQGEIWEWLALHKHVRNKKP
jgi:hypothetical protein